jgi:hypothetical protein
MQACNPGAACAATGNGMLSSWLVKHFTGTWLHALVAQTTMCRAPPGVCPAAAAAMLAAPCTATQQGQQAARAGPACSLPPSSLPPVAAPSQHATTVSPPAPTPDMPGNRHLQPSSSSKLQTPNQMHGLCAHRCRCHRLPWQQAGRCCGKTSVPPHPAAATRRTSCCAPQRLSGAHKQLPAGAGLPLPLPRMRPVQDLWVDLALAPSLSAAHRCCPVLQLLLPVP